MAREVNYEKLAEAIGETIVGASTRMPEDVAAALKRAFEVEENEASRSALGFIVENNRLAVDKVSPICQDTGYPTFYVERPSGYDRGRIEQIIVEKLAEKTRASLLRPNAVDPVSGKNTGDNSGIAYPALYFSDASDDRLVIRLLLKGGGSENVSGQYKLPHAPLKAGRDLEGVRKVVLDGVLQAQGFGCGPGLVGVAIGADRAQGYALAKKQLLRPLADRSEDPQLAELEGTIESQANELGIGAMGFGGKTTVLGVKVAKAHRHPASFFVTIAYGCWALRRKTLSYDESGYTITD